MDTKICSSCKVKKPVSEFKKIYKEVVINKSMIKKRQGGLCNTCLQCRIIQRRYDRKKASLIKS